mgnify:CR=1 FL=1
MSYAQTIAMATDLLAEGRAADVVRMVAPLVDGPPTADADPDVIRLHTLLARVESAHRDDADAALQRLKAFEDADARAALSEALRAEVALWLGWAHARRNAEADEEARALRLLDEAEQRFAALHAPHGRCWAHIGRAQAYFALDEYHLMRRTLDEAADLHARTQDVQADAWIHDLQVPALRFRGRYDAAQSHIDALRKRGQSANDRRLRGRAAAHQAALDYDRGRPPAHVIDVSQTAETLLRALDGRPGYPLLAAYHARIGALLRQGAWDQAEAQIDDAESVMRPYRLGQAHLDTLRARLAYRRGQCEKAGALLEALFEHAHRLPHGLHRSHVALLRGELLSHWNEYDDAGTWIERSVQNARETGHRGDQLRSLLTLASVAQDHGDWATAADAIARADAYGDYRSVLPYVVLRFRVLGVQAQHDGRLDDARGAFTQATSAASLIGDVYETARLQMARATLGPVDAARARPLLEAASTTFDRLGATRDAARAHALLADLADGPPPFDAAGTQEPTPGWTPSPIGDALGGHLARASFSVDLVAEAWLQSVERLLPGHWMGVYRRTPEGTWTRVHAHGTPPPVVANATDPLPTLPDADALRWMALRGDTADTADAFRMGVDADADAWARALPHLDPWLPVVRLALDRALLCQQTDSSASSGTAAPLVGDLVAESPAMQAVVRQIDRIRTSHSPVLITGARGTGKEQVAEAVHRTSTRADGPLVHVRCASMQRDPLARRLFGHANAAAQTTGAVHDAAGGTLVLHDVGDLSERVQAALVRLLDTGAVVPVGANTPQRADVRVLALTTADLSDAVQRGAFREDLYHHLNVIRLRVPPLRERREDIPLLARAFLNTLRPAGTPLASITDRALDALLRYDWPGNLRQLRNEIERALVFVGNEPAPTIDVHTLSDAVLDAASPEPLPPPTAANRDATPRSDAPAVPSGFDLDAILDADVTLRDVLARAETAIIERALRECGGQVTATADLLGLSRQGLYKKMKRLSIDPARFHADAASPA